VSAIRVPWSSASFLVYLGGLTLFASLASLLVAQADDYGSGGFVSWALLVFLATEACALFALVNGRRVTAGLLALSAVAAWVVLLGALLDWFGWLAHTNSPFAGFHLSHLFLELALVFAAAAALAVFRFPLLVFPLAAGTWFFVTDLISGGGDWSAVVTVIVGLMLLSWAVAVDRGSTRPYAFWLHVVAGLTFGGGLLWLFHKGDWDWILIGLVALLYIWIGDRLVRSSWVVLGAWALLQTTAHFAAKMVGRSARRVLLSLPVPAGRCLRQHVVRAGHAPVGGGALLRGHRGRLHPHRVAARAAPAHRDSGRRPALARH
jgi:hypothetical protein